MLFLKVSVFTYFILSVLAGKGVFFEIYLSCILICFVYLTNRSHFPVRSYCNRSRMTSQRMTSQYNSRRSRVALVTVVLYTLWRLLFFKSDYSTHTHARENVIYLFYIIKIQMDYWRSCRVFGACGKKTKTANVIWSGLTSSLHVS